MFPAKNGQKKNQNKRKVGLYRRVTRGQRVTTRLGRIAFSGLVRRGTVHSEGVFHFGEQFWILAAQIHLIGPVTDLFIAR